MTDNLSLKSWLAFYESGAFDAADIDTQCRAELWGRENDFAEPILTGTMQDIYAYFGV